MIILGWYLQELCKHISNFDHYCISFLRIFFWVNEDERNELIVACKCTDLQLQHPFLDSRSRFSRQLKANHHLPVEWKAKDLLFFHLLMSSWQGAALVQESHLVKIKSKLTTFPLLWQFGIIHRLNIELSVTEPNVEYPSGGLVKFVYQCRRLLLSGGEARTRLIKYGSQSYLDNQTIFCMQDTLSFLFVIQILNFGKEVLVKSWLK